MGFQPLRYERQPIVTNSKEAQRHEQREGCYPLLRRHGWLKYVDWLITSLIKPSYSWQYQWGRETSDVQLPLRFQIPKIQNTENSVLLEIQDNTTSTSISNYENTKCIANRVCGSSKGKLTWDCDGFDVDGDSSWNIYYCRAQVTGAHKLVTQCNFVIDLSQIVGK